VIVLRRVEGLSQRETAARLNISLKAVEQHTTKGMRMLVDFLLGHSDSLTTERRSFLGRRRRDERG
jgi:DNA-directed RNA polymerase specialized sigma24 family protein